MSFDEHWASLVKRGGPHLFGKAERETARLFYYFGIRDQVEKQVVQLRAAVELLDINTPAPV